MNEITEVRQEIERERAQMARSARNGAPRRTRNSSCELHSDFLTRAEREKLNGPVFTLDLKRFYTAEEFKALPVSMQVRYLNYLFEKYWPLGTSTFSEDIFRMSESWLSLHVKRNGYRDQLKMPGRGQNNSAAYIKAISQLTLDLQAFRNGPPPAEAVTEEAVTPEEIAPKEDTAPETAVMPAVGTISSMDISLNGFEGLIQMLEMLRGMMPANVHIRIQIDKED